MFFFTDWEKIMDIASKLDKPGEEEEHKDWN